MSICKPCVTWLTDSVKSALRKYEPKKLRHVYANLNLVFVKVLFEEGKSHSADESDSSLYLTESNLKRGAGVKHNAP